MVTRVITKDFIFQCQEVNLSGNKLTIVKVEFVKIHSGDHLRTRFGFESSEVVRTKFTINNNTKTRT